jgi:signal transduction histidine kinase/ActR/RegA family two-component response regulator
MKDGGLQDLESQLKELTMATRLPDSVLQPNAPAEVKGLDLAYARQLLGSDEPWGREDAFQESARIVTDVLSASDKGRRLYLASEIGLIRQVLESGQECIHTGPFDIKEAVFPVRIGKQVIHLLRSGKFREEPFTEDDLKDLSQLTTLPIKKIQPAADALPIFPASAHEQLFTVYRRLRDAVSQALSEHLRASQLAGAQLKLERMYSLGTLAESMAHHFNNLLSIILGYSSMMLDRSELSDEASDALQKVTEAAQKGRRFTEEILAVAGSQEEQEAPCSIHERINGVLTLVAARTPGVTVETHLDAPHDTVIAPPGIVHQVVFNLLTNALESMPNGGTMTVTTLNEPDEASMGLSEFLKITVTDTSTIDLKRPLRRSETIHGLPGAPPKEKMTPKMTSIFGLVGRIDGTVTMASEPGQPTRVEIILRAAEPATDARKEKKFRRRLAPSHIWVADDDPIVREMCKRVLLEDGHSVEEVSSGAELQERLKKDSKPDLVVYDFNMPDYSGLEMVTWMRENELRIPTILLSGFKMEHPDVARTLKYRKTFFVQKPFSFRDMADMVTIALGETLVEVSG